MDNNDEAMLHLDRSVSSEMDPPGSAGNSASVLGSGSLDRGSSGGNDSAFPGENGASEGSQTSERKNGVYPADCYSFIAIHGPIESPLFFGFGFTVWAFQIAFLILLVLRVASPKLSTNEDTDNPDDGFLSEFIPSNVGPLSRATQLMALLSYCVFADESLKDIVTAVETWPRLDRAKPGDKVRLIMLSSVLRFSQGMLATISVLLLVITTADVIDIILNFTAVNFISAFDDVAFELAQWGKYGPRLEAEAHRIEKLPAPDCIFRKYQHVRYRFTVLPIAFVLIFLFSVMAFRQDSRNYWLTQTMRVQFQDDSVLTPYSGCYDMTDLSRKKFYGSKRVNYEGYEDNPSIAKFGYCADKRKWYMYAGNETDACSILREEQLAYSEITYAYDISSSFESTWYSPSGTPLELYFFEDEDSLNAEVCASFLGDGICNKIFNTAEYDFDQGDCCAATCDHAQCGMGTLTESFGTNLTKVGDGYPKCDDPEMKYITILVNDVYRPTARPLLGGGDTEQSPIDMMFGQQDLAPTGPTMIIDCDGKNLLKTTIDPEMENKTETIRVSDGASCTMMVKNSTISINKVWYVNYTVFHGDETSINNEPIVMAKGNSFEEEIITFRRVKDCFFEKLDGIIDRNTIYTDNGPSNQAVEWLMNDPSAFSNCEDPFFVERYALATINFAAPVASGAASAFNESRTNKDDRVSWITPDRHCVWAPVGCIEGSVGELNFVDTGLKVEGTIATEIGLLSNMQAVDMNEQMLYGSIPSEIGLLTNLRLLSINQNNLGGTIPTELGKLSNLRLLDLNSNGGYGSGIEGSIPLEFMNMSALEVALLYTNALTGSIPNQISKLSSSLIGIALDGNSINGTIPSSIGEMANMAYLGMSYNFITGTIPSELGRLEARNIAMDFNLLTGKVPLEILQNEYILDLGVYGNGLSDLSPVPGSEICVRVPSSTPSNFDIFGSMGGEHYCDCSNNCLPVVDRPNLCECEAAKSCCDESMSKYTECIVCEYGIANPNLFVEQFGVTCGEAIEYVRTSISEFGTKEQCDTARNMGLGFGCICNTEPLLNSEEELDV